MTAHATDLLRRVEAVNGRLEPNGDLLKVRAPQPLPQKLIDEVRQAKPELLALLADDPDPERAAIMEFDGGLQREEAERLAALPDVPAEWIDGVARLQHMAASSGWTDLEWRQFQTDAMAFLTTWGAQAHGMGWTAVDLFGCHPRAPRARYDAMGLVLMLGGHSVVAMGERMARIGIRDGVTQSFNRRQCITEPVLIWEIHGKR